MADGKPGDVALQRKLAAAYLELHRYYRTADNRAGAIETMRHYLDTLDRICKLNPAEFDLLTSKKQTGSIASESLDVYFRDTQLKYARQVARITEQRYQLGIALDIATDLINAYMRIVKMLDTSRCEEASEARGLMSARPRCSPEAEGKG